jgi:hypothetical protein
MPPIHVRKLKKLAKIGCQREMSSQLFLLTIISVVTKALPSLRNRIHYLEMHKALMTDYS